MGVLLALALLTSGLHGVVVRGPTAPVCRVGVPCSKPAVGAVLVFSRGARVVRVRVAARGRYSVRLAPGVWSVRVAPTPRVGFGIRPARVDVAADARRRVDFQIDTGIR